MPMTQAELARRVGVSAKTIVKWKERGYLKLQGKLVDIDATLASIQRGHPDGGEIVRRFKASEQHNVTGAGLGKVSAPEVKLSGGRGNWRKRAAAVATSGPFAASELVVKGYRTEREAEDHARGVLGGLIAVALEAPALAAEIAAKHGMAPRAIVPFYEELRGAVAAVVNSEMEEEDISLDFAIDYYDLERGEFLPLGDFRQPGEDQETRWARIVPENRQ